MKKGDESKEKTGQDGKEQNMRNEKRGKERKEE